MKSLNILYVEDNDRLRETIGELLESADRKVHAVASAEEALIAFADNSFDVLVTDVSLPGMSGVDLARRVLTTNPHYWVVLCTGYEFKHRLTGLGINVRLLSKPFEIEALEALMDEITLTVKSSSPISTLESKAPT